MTLPFSIAGHIINKGETRDIDIVLARLYDFTELTMTVRVIRGFADGPTVFVSGAIHGDEIIGTEIIKRVSGDKRLRKVRGTLLLIPIVNAFGFNNLSRYLPDRRDLNRCFPGSNTGSLGAQIALTFVDEILSKCQYGIDLHSGSNHRSNLPQIRACLDDPETERIARAFGAPVILNSKLRDGSLRAASDELGVKTIVFEGGEGLRCDEAAVKIAHHGVFSVLRAINMLPPAKVPRKISEPYVATSSYWVRAPQSGFHSDKKRLGAQVAEGIVLGTVTDALGRSGVNVLSRSNGVIIGENRLPLVNRGDALFHIATFEDSEEIRELARYGLDWWEPLVADHSE